MRITASVVVGVIVVASATPALAQSRNCTSSERNAANAQLLLIQSNAARRATILERHLPLGVPVSRHIVDGGPDNEDLLAQEGYALLHDKDLRTALWVAYRLTSADLGGASGQDRVNCFRRDPRFSAAESGIPTDYRELSMAIQECGILTRWSRRETSVGLRPFLVENRRG